MLLVNLTIITYSQSREIDSLKNKLATTIEDTTRVLALVSLGYYSKHDTAFIVDEEALQLARKIKYKRGEGRALAQFANDFISVNNYPKGLQYSLQGLKVFEQIDDKNGIGSSYFNISRVYTARGDYHKAIYYLHNALSVGADTGWTGLELVYLYLGRNYEKLNKLDSALIYYQRSYEIFSDNSILLTTLLSSLGDVHAKLGHTELAFAFYRMGMEKRRSDVGSTEFGRNYYGLATLFSQQGNIDSSIYYAQKALEAAKTNPEMTSKSSILLSQLYEPTDSKQSFYYFKLATTTKDSTYEAGKLLLLNNMSFNEEQRQKEKAQEEVKARQERNHNLQYAAIAVALITFIILFLVLSRSIIVKQKFIEFFAILGLLSVFEFINLFIHPYLANITNNSPVLMLIILIAIGALLIPLHHKLEKWITKIMIEKNKRIRLAAAKKTIATLEGEI